MMPWFPFLLRSTEAIPHSILLIQETTATTVIPDSAKPQQQQLQKEVYKRSTYDVRTDSERWNPSRMPQNSKSFLHSRCTGIRFSHTLCFSFLHQWRQNIMIPFPLSLHLRFFVLLFSSSFSYKHAFFSVLMLFTEIRNPPRTPTRVWRQCWLWCSSC